MKTGFYIHNGSKTVFSGVERKIKDQMKVLSEYCDITEIIVEKEKTNIFKSIRWRLPGGSMGMKYDEALKRIADCVGESDEVSFFYIRSSLLDERYMHFLKALRTDYSKAKILLEVPTYPHDKELLKNRTMWPWYFKDRKYRKDLKGCVDRIVTFSVYNEIFGIPTIKSMNGIDVASVRPIRCGKDDGMIRLIAVAMMQPYHGYERLIKGLASYYENPSTRKIKLYMIGYGSELDYYKKLASDYRLNGVIEFKGKLTGDLLDEAYDDCDLAVGSLGGYKIGINVFSSIKLGDYLAKGLPVITGAKALVFEKYGNEWNLDFPNDDSEIDINRVVDFYDHIYAGKDKGEIHKKVRDFAMRTIDVHIAMNDIISYINEQ